MKGMWLLFISLSLGTISTISLGGAMYNLRYVEVVMFILLAALLFKLIKSGLTFKINGYDKLAIILWFVCLFYSILTFYWSNQSMTAMSGSLVIFFAILSLPIAWYYIYKNPDIFVKVNRFFIVILFIQLLVNMIDIFGTYGMSFYQMKEQSNTLIGNSNYVSFFFTFGLLYELIAKEKRWQLHLLINSFGLILTISRGAIIALAICLIVYMIIMLLNPKTKKIKSILSLGFLGVLLTLFIKYTVPGAELWASLQFGLEASSVGSRQILWDQAINQIANNPFGNGIVWDNDPHNIILRAFRDLGLFFGLIFLFLIGYPLLHFLRPRILKYNSKSIAVLIAYLSVFIHSLIEVFYLTSTSIVWTVMALVFLNATIRSEKNTVNVKEEVRDTKQKERRIKKCIPSVYYSR